MRITFFLFFVLLFSCHSNNGQTYGNVKQKLDQKLVHRRTPGRKIIHVFVALCDNKYQGIVPVPAKIGNGQDPSNNLYWGCNYGVKTFFGNSKEWKLQKTYNDVSEYVLERCIFKHLTSNTWLIADAYNGQYIKRCTEDFLSASSGGSVDSITLKDGKKIFTAGSSDLLAYVGHDGLMDFNIDNNDYVSKDSLKREVIILACISKSYFSSVIKQTGALPVLWTTGLMAPEAYILHDALSEWIKSQSGEQIRNAAAAAYSKYQKCSIKAAKNLLVTDW